MDAAPDFATYCRWRRTDDRLGDLAMQIRVDTSFPVTGEWETIQAYLSSYNAALDLIQDTWTLYKEFCQVREPRFHHAS